MPRAVIVAAGDLDSLPAEVQGVANILSSADWTVRLCIGADASRAGLLAWIEQRRGKFEQVWPEVKA